MTLTLSLTAELIAAICIKAAGDYLTKHSLPDSDDLKQFM